MANIVRGFLASVCGFGEAVVDITMEEIEGGGDNAVQVVVPSCFDRMEEVWHGWNCATKVCVAATGAIIIVGSMMSIGGLYSLALGGAVVAPTLTTASTIVTSKAGDVIEEVSITKDDSENSCTMIKGADFVKLGKYERKGALNIYHSKVPEVCFDIFKELNIYEPYELLKEDGYSLWFEIKKDSTKEQGYYNSTKFKQPSYFVNADNTCNGRSMSLTQKICDFIDEAIQLCGF